MTQTANGRAIAALMALLLVTPGWAQERVAPATGAISQVEYLQRQIDERDRRYEDRFKAQETAVLAALAAQEKLVSAAFLASEKAIVKAEEAQRDYNIRSNEFRGQLDDQAKTLLPRAEADGRFDNLVLQIEEIKTEIAGLRESRSAGTGRDDAVAAAETTQRWVIGIGLTIVLFVVAQFLMSRKP